MFDIGFWEIILILIVALVILGPERLPGIAITLGRYWARARGLWQKAKNEIDHTIKLEELRQRREQAEKAEQQMQQNEQQSNQ